MQYEIKELTIGQMLPIFDLIQSDPKAFQMAMVKLAVYKDGVALGEEALNLPVSEYMKLAVEVMEKHNFSGDEGKS
jgi:hypothetical protein